MKSAALLLVSLVLLDAADASANKPNIIYILADDLGYGDVHCLNPERGKIKTPNLDRMAAQGMVFTEAHSGSSVCTPTRYGIITGRYSWRTQMQKGVLDGYGKPLVAMDRLTVPGFLKQHGYATACIGKWHLGMTMDQKNPNAPVGDGPTTRGFDFYFGISASLDMPPYAYIENDRFTEAPTVEKKWIRAGPAAPGFEAVDVLPMLTRKATEFISQRAKADKPFFLYLPLASPHTPIVPTPEWQGKSGLGAYADFVMQTDASVGQVLDALGKAGIADNTLVLFTSDNGCSPSAKVEELESKGHFPSEGRRGYKADILDGGHRVPFIARWPARIKGGGRTDQLTCLADLMATAADIVGAKLPDNAGEDSFSLMPLFKGEDKPIRENAVSASVKGTPAVRKGSWKYIPAPGGDESQPVQLYNLADDIGETKNHAAAMPEKLAEMKALLEKLITAGRSTPGAAQKNDVEVVRYPSKSATKPRKKKTNARTAPDVSR